MPGVLPVLNQKVVDYAIKLGLATDSQINPRSLFARKNYFYPDLPKGYQISQFEAPFCEHGYLDIQVDNDIERIGILRIHAEEDAGKSMHSEAYVDTHETLVDVNRCGVPLLEIVSKPEIRSARHAYAYLKSMRQMVRYLGICDGNMEEGSLRCDANVSIRPHGQQTLGTKTEVKNMNSFQHVEKALEFEIERQIEVLESGGEIVQETRLWDATRGITQAMRSKEYSHDYRYFPEPDLIPVEIDQKRIDTLQATLPERPLEKMRRFVKDYQLPEYDAALLTEDCDLANYYEAVASRIVDKKMVSNWVMGEVIRALNEKHCTVDDLAVSPDYLVELLELIEKEVINQKIAKVVFQDSLKTGRSPVQIVEEKGLAQISDTDELVKVVKDVLDRHPREVQDYLGGKTKLLGFFIGQIMRATQGKANPKSVNDILTQALSKRR
jgi:aspartyl-tRNA(Asn)/glutamyl-tRNA(Gln) amidotransferase subunit B